MTCALLWVFILIGVDGNSMRCSLLGIQNAQLVHSECSGSLVMTSLCTMFTHSRTERLGDALLGIPFNYFTLMSCALCD